MTLYQFIMLDKRSQSEEVWKGNFMTFREEEGAVIALYRVHDFYVEVYYDSGTNQVVRLNPFRSRARLGLYLSMSLN